MICLEGYITGLSGLVVGIIGMAMWCDGLASIWAYWDKKETWWRNHSLRALRMLNGLILMAVAVVLVILGVMI